MDLVDEPYNRPYFKATAFAAAGDTDSAFVYLEEAFEVGSMYCGWIGVDPYLDSIRSDPRLESCCRGSAWTDEREGCDLNIPGEYGTFGDTGNIY